MTAVARRAGPGRDGPEHCAPGDIDGIEPGGRRRPLIDTCRAACTSAPAASPTRAGSPRFYPTGLRGIGVPERTTPSRLGGGRAEQHLLRLRRQATEVGAWVDATPDHFRFASRPSGAARSGRSRRIPAAAVPWLTGPYRAFGERLGTVLFRVPDGVRRDDARLAAMLAVWPADLPLTMEFQDPSWHVDETFAALAGVGAALCATDSRGQRAADPAPDRAVPVPAAAAPRLRAEEIAAWASRLEPFLAAGDDAFVFFRRRGRSRRRARA